MADDFGGGKGGGGGFSFGGFGGAKISSSTFSNIGGAVSDLFSSQETAAGLRIKAQGDIAEGQAYDLAGGLAGQNAAFTNASTRIKEMQADRELSMSLGETKADVGASGFAAGGSSLDILRDSAAQGALNRAVLTEQGAITEAGYKEQQQSYGIMSAAAKSAATQEQSLASNTELFGGISAAIKGATAVASIFL